MPEAVRYTIFQTGWGHFGLVGNESGLRRTCLPMAQARQVESLLLESHPTALYDRRLFQTLRRQIIAYFDGACVNFNRDIPILLEGLSPFAHSVLTACRNVRYAETISYGELAAKVRCPKAARAIGGLLARNPTPLIIPCHRVVRGDGKIGGFSAAGGIPLKRRMLEIEERTNSSAVWSIPGSRSSLG
ncbi:MAG TPA: methylated-DNA--[protein]-cysteine S-methyltransferase [Sedimentisphaerales bacterium]|nr:methylated-DNA--[protein]-cysteine S-methyltransferase [Sedimentisphaerales bacterium]